MTPLAEQESIDRLERLRAKGHDPVAIIKTSIANSWTGLFEPKTDPKAAAKSLRERDNEENSRIMAEIRGRA